MPGREIPWSRWIPKLVTVLVVLLLVALILPAIEQSREAARRSQNMNHLKQLGLALHNYHDAYKCFPPGGIVAEDGTAYHGWYTFLMPFLVKSYAYNNIDFDYPWTDPVNEFVFLGTYYPGGEHNPKIDLCFTTDGYGVMHYSGNSRLLYRNSSVSLKEIDDHSRTWMISDAFEKWLPWGSPCNWRELEWPLPGSDQPYAWPGGAFLLFADGHVEFVALETDPAVIEAYRSGVASVPAERTQKPDLRYTYTEKEPSVEWRSTRPGDEESATMSVSIGGDGQPVDLTVRISDEFKHREVTSTDLKFAIQQYPGVRTIRARIDLDDDVAELFGSTTKLECLVVNAISLTDAGIEQLQKVSSLRILQGGASSETVEKLKRALPDCELRIRLPVASERDRPRQDE